VGSLRILNKTKRDDTVGNDYEPPHRFLEQWWIENIETLIERTGYCVQDYQRREDIPLLCRYGLSRGYRVLVNSHPSSICVRLRKVDGKS
jgi:hypothetical protein